MTVINHDTPEPSAEFPCGDAPAPFIAGPVGMLEALTSCPAPETTVAASAVICHPHPLHGGTMQNKVVHTLARSFSELGLRTLRFNFRGVGRSAGNFADGVGETDDLIAVLDWVRARRPHDGIWLAGFSFGAYVATRACGRRPVDRLITVAPAVNRHDFSSLNPPCPWLVIQGGQDEIVPVEAVRALVGGIDPKPAYVELAGVSHFFHQRLNDLGEVLRAELTPHLPQAVDRSSAAR